MDNPTNKLNSNSRFTPFLFPLLVFVIFFFLLLHIFFLFSPNKDALTTLSTTLITLTSFFVLGIFVTVLTKMKSSGPSSNKNGATSFFSIFNSNLALLVVYVISLIFIFSWFSSQTINKYAIYFLLGTVIPGIFLFYKNIVQESATVYSDEKIRFFITILSFVTTMILFYHTDPGGYIKKYFGTTMLFTILLTILGMLYMITLFLLPDSSKNSSSEKTNFFDDFKSKGFTSPSVLFTIAFLLYLILITIGISIYPGGVSGFFKNKSLETVGIMISIFVTLILAIAFFMSNFQFFGKSTSSVNDADKINPIFKNAFLLIFGLSFSGAIVGWLAYMITSLSSGSGIFSFVLNLLLIIAVLSLVYRLVIGTSLYKQPFFKLIINILFYIPCLFVGLIEGIVWLFGSIFKLFGYTEGIQLTDGKTDKISLIILVITILLFLVYLFRPSIERQIYKQGGNLLVNQPISTNELNSISDYLTLNQPLKTYDYQYGISFWFRLDADSPSTNASYNKYSTILNYGGKPNVMYNASTNTMIVTMKLKDEESMSMSSSPVLSRDEQSRDENGDLIVYTKTNVLLQKWNHIVINYNGGTLDVFYNGELVKSVYGVVPYMEYDALTVGEEKGVYGQLCSLNYFNKNLNLSQVYYLYHLVKNRDPPITYDADENIIKQPKLNDNIRGSFGVSRKKVGDLVVTEPKIAGKTLSKLNPVDPENYFSLRWYFGQQGDDYGMP